MRLCSPLRLSQAVALALPASAAHAQSVLSPQGPVAAGDAEIMVDALVIMLGIVIPTILLALGMAWRYRASNSRARYLPNWSYSGRLELIVWSIPLLVILFLSGVIWVGSYRLDPGRPLPSTQPPLQVQVVSLDWKWLFIYPQQGIATVNRLVIPAGTPVRFDLTSASVMNGFFVPRLGSMIAVMNGMVTRLNLQADRPGRFYGRSTQFSGDGFSDMDFQVDAVAPADFAAWAAGARGQGGMLDQAGYVQLARQSRKVAPTVYGGVQPGLFQAIAAQALPPGPGPAVGRGGADVSPRTTITGR